MHKTAAWPLTLMYAVLVVYASLYPFGPWVGRELAPFAFVAAPLPRYWTGFDVAVNVAGYVPLGALLALSALRGGPWRSVVWLPVLMGGALSLAMEALQTYLPGRVPSREDCLLNTLGVVLGVVLALRLQKVGVVQRWSHFRARWLVEDSRGALVLLLLWPLALLFPASIPFGLGQVVPRLQAALESAMLSWGWVHAVPVWSQWAEPLTPVTVAVSVWQGLMIPFLLGCCVIRHPLHRLVFAGVVGVVGVAVTALSAALSWGPQQSWVWLDGPTLWGMGLAVLAVAALVWVPWRVAAALALLALGFYLSALNQVPADPYLSQTLQEWEQGRFIRFNGLAQWLGWLWPYVSAVYFLSLLWTGERET